MRATLPEVSDELARERLALGHREVLTGDVDADLARLRRLAALELALGQPEEAILTWSTALQLSDLDVATSEPAELEPARARREALRRAALADAPRWGGDEVLIRALIGVEDPASFTEALAHVGRGFASPTLTGELPQALLRALPPRAFLYRPVHPEALSLDPRPLRAAGPAAIARLEALLLTRHQPPSTQATRRGAAEALLAVDPHHTLARLALQLLERPETAPLAAALIHEATQPLVLAHRERPTDPAVRLALAWRLIEQGLHADAAALLAEPVPEPMGPTSELLRALADGEVEAYARRHPELARSPYWVRRLEADPTPLVARHGGDAPRRALVHVAFAPDAPERLRRLAIEHVRRSSFALGAVAERCLTAGHEEACAAAGEEGVRPARVRVPRGPISSEELSAMGSLEPTGEELRSLRRWLRSYEGTEVSLRPDWIATSIYLALRARDASYARRLLTAREPLLDERSRDVLRAHLSIDRRPDALSPLRRSSRGVAPEVSARLGVETLWDREARRAAIARASGAARARMILIEVAGTLGGPDAEHLEALAWAARALGDEAPDAPERDWLEAWSHRAAGRHREALRSLRRVALRRGTPGVAADVQRSVDDLRRAATPAPGSGSTRRMARRARRGRAGKARR
ncbi:MAG: hypothetical protein RLP09_20745 [Sandaracinaceae bacterium]